MGTLQLCQNRTGNKLRVIRSVPDLLGDEYRHGKRWLINKSSKLTSTEVVWERANWPCEAGEFFKGMPDKARNAFAAIASRFQCPGATVLICEEQAPSSLLILLDGKVKISMNSFDGRRFLLGVASVGDTLGLTSVVSGIRSEIRAEAMYPCTFASLRREDFLKFMIRHPATWQNVGQELGQQYAQACERLRMFGLTSSAKSRLASLLLEWCRDSHRTASGTQAWCVLTHGEIGECIGTSRETVTRLLMDFKNRGLAELRGTILIIPSRVALANYAAIESFPESQEPIDCA